MGRVLSYSHGCVVSLSGMLYVALLVLHLFCLRAFLFVVLLSLISLDMFSF